MSILSLLALIIIILIIGFIAKFKGPRLSPRLSRIALLAYCAILFISAAIVQLLPTANLRQQLDTEQDLNSQANIIAAGFMEIARQGNLDHTPGIYKNAGYHFQFAGNLLVLKLDDNFPCEILVYRRPSEEEFIEASSYVTSCLIQNTDITEQILPPVFNLSNNTLTISPPDRYKLDFISFKKDFTSAQFSSSSPGSESSGNYAVFGRKAVYLSIPKNMQIEAGQHQLTYLNS